MRANIALNPATGMRSSIPSSERIGARRQPRRRRHNLFRPKCRPIWPRPPKTRLSPRSKPRRRRLGLKRRPGLAKAPVPALFEFRSIALDPPHDRRVRQRKPALGHHLDEITKAKFVPQIPAHAEHDDLPVEWRPLKRSSTFNMLGQVHRGLICRRICDTPTIRTRTSSTT